MQMLEERGEIAPPEGQKIVSILLLEDLLIVPLLAFVAFLAPEARMRHAASAGSRSAIALGALAAL
jgi:glutathione-regulated potassium-efflux system protein KefB